ncbi:MAG: 50S ribosomal protein L25 [Candidatus Azambacteria bacterium GW2011_GWC2_45_7b]|uniref:Large ribosomal subunit protein bL25 n=4 Tax=Parcubacteria group TaxID=1794811 RepID=A0A837ILR1_9BACT|nr:MAG: 50S ribosomal protein L25 [Parcubacteria group bacterium GW2011_GWC1_44_10]KKT57073.1 MAG: 50S ribosomal protein L25 [Candidatus Giovannonibacteria bacterium GW2011_GWB1_44_23]KKT59510.1 MAG: 50S ribosomal protein L25 [Candidatus Giovannonibacteria bacterium GW2011_GWA1_44_25]KKU13044.1 MAG: 50S ribosomal protein L25 [Candidatus Azambacteria bacterium GW2011_GWC2_45_7b]
MGYYGFMQSIVAEKRDILGKKVRNLRKQGFLPAAVYGGGKNAEAISVKEADFMKLWKSAGESTVVELDVGNDRKNVLIHDVDIDPIKDKPIHVDFYAVDMTKKIHVDVALEFIGESEAVKSGGVLVKVFHSLKVEALPKDLPHTISVDISALKSLEDSIKVKDLALPAKVKALDGPDETVVLVETPRVEEEVKAEETPSLESIEVVSKKPKAGEEEEAAEETPKKEK